jgi:hypothetical protein
MSRKFVPVQSHQKWVRGNNHPTQETRSFSWKRPSDKCSTAVSQPSSMSQETCPARDIKKSKIDTETITLYRKVGKHKLVVANPNHSTKAPASSSSTAAVAATAADGPMIRIGRNKLIASLPSATRLKNQNNGVETAGIDTKRTKTNNPATRTTAVKKPCAATRNRGKGSKKWKYATHSQRQTAKRIPLSIQPHESLLTKGTSAQTCECKNVDDDSSCVNQDSAATADVGGGWTDHAYRPSNGTSSGLVRVTGNSRSTRICPAFVRGIHCSNPALCKLRHDVPKECAMPLCHYFQKNGMCFRTDCPFRHVKVSASAESCPSFKLLGFCKDTECPLLHVTSPQTQSRKDGS